MSQIASPQSSQSQFGALKASGAHADDHGYRSARVAEGGVKLEFRTFRV